MQLAAHTMFIYKAGNLGSGGGGMGGGATGYKYTHRLTNSTNKTALGTYDVNLTFFSKTANVHESGNLPQHDCNAINSLEGVNLESIFCAWSYTCSQRVTDHCV